MLPGPASRSRRSADPDSAQPRPDVGELAARAAEHDGLADRGRALAALAGGLASSGRAAGVRAVGAGRWLGDVLAEAAPRIRVRDRLTLQVHHPGRTDDEIAEALVRHASMATAAFGAAAGALAAAEFAAPPTLLAAPVQLAAETLAMAAVEVKLVAELHELYRQPASGTLRERGSAYLMSWVRQRAVEPAVSGGGIAGVLGRAAKRELRARLLRRIGRNLTTLAPFLAGALAGAEVNRRATRALGDKVAAELRGRLSRRGR